MNRGRAFASVLGVLAALFLSVTGCLPGSSPTAIQIGGVRTTGPLYLPGSPVHSCTASVLTSPTRDLVITAAHCLAGSGLGVTIVPGSVNGSAPYGRWIVTAAYVDPGWTRHQDPLRDVAILRVAPQYIKGAIHRIEDLTGGNRLITTPASIGAVVVPAYVAGIGGRPITCLATAYRDGAYSAFDCGGYADGVSGAPWIQGRNVLGVIGGLHQGGCTPSTSYSAPFDATTLATFHRAVTASAGDILPVPGSDGC